jgi:DNA-binding CsgD family transcriptional regulator
MGAAIVDEMVKSVQAEVNVNLVGRRGSGRTTALAAAAEQLLPLGRTIHRIAGISHLRDRPLAALAVSGIDLRQPGGSIAATVAALSRALAGPRSVLVVDDADELDEVSLGAIVAARARTAFTVLAATRLPAGRAAAAPPLLHVLQPTVRLRLRPLAFAELHGLVHDLLPGTVAAPTVALIATLTGGLPGLVQAVIATARRAGRLEAHDGLWQATGPLYSDRLAEAVAALLTDAGPDELDALVALALAHGLPLPEAEHVFGRALVNRLEEAELTRLTPGDTPVVAVYPPLVAEHLRHQCPASRRQQALADLAAAGVDTGHIPDPPGSGPAGHDPTVFSQRIHDHWRAESGLRRAAWQAHPTAATAIPLLAALHLASAPPAEAEAVLAATDPAAGEAPWRARLALWRALHLAVHRDDLAAATAHLDAAARALPGQASVLAAAHAHLVLLSDHVPDDVPDPRSGPAEPPDASLAAAHAEVLLARGQSADALALLDRRPPPWPFLAGHWEVLANLARLLDGRLERAAADSGHALDRARAQLVSGWCLAHGYVHVLALGLAGRFAELEAATSALLTLTGQSTLYAPYQGGLLTIAAVTAAWQGQAGFARDLAGQAAATRPGPFPFMLGPATPAVLGGPGQAADLWAAVADRLDRGYTSAATFAAALATDHQGPPAGDLPARIGTAAAACQSPVVRALGAYTAAAAAQDPAGLRRAAAALREAGLAIPAFRAAVRLAATLRRAGDAPAAARVAGEAWSATALPSAVRHVLFQPFTAAVDLSARELEVARLIADGLAPAQAAASLNLSIHTVQNHLASIYRKAGVSARPDLLDALGTWLADPVTP